MMMMMMMSLADVRMTLSHAAAFLKNVPPGQGDARNYMRGKPTNRDTTLLLLLQCISFHNGDLHLSLL